MPTLKYLYIYALLVLYSCFTSLEICNCCNPVLLIFIYTPAFLVLFLLCVCMYVPAYWPTRVCAAK